MRYVSCHKRLARFHSAPHKVVDRVKLNAAVHHDGDIPTPIGGPDGRAGDVTRPDGRRARYAARHFDAGLYRKIRHGHGRDLAARRELGGKGGDFIGAKEQLSILQIVPAPVEPDLEAPAGPPCSAGEARSSCGWCKTYTNRARIFIERVIFRTVPARGLRRGAVRATALRASQHTLSMFSRRPGRLYQ